MISSKCDLSYTHMRAWNYPHTLPWARNGQHPSTEFWYEFIPSFPKSKVETWSEFG